MNIFVTSFNPNEAASYLDDKRVVKMVLESAQMLSTAINQNGGNGPYKDNHINHPCSIWVRKSRANYLWLVQHFSSLCAEYTNRYNKTHKCSQFIPKFIEGQKYIKLGIRTNFQNCTTFKHIDNVTLAYKMYLYEKWKNDKRVPTWYGKIK
jgi:hypothetical protein